MISFTPVFGMSFHAKSPATYVTLITTFSVLISSVLLVVLTASWLIGTLMLLSPF
jgi:hypothetical protein